MMYGTKQSSYQIIVLSENFFFWLGVKTLISMMFSPRPDVFWIRGVNPENILQMREQVMTNNAGQRWLVFTEAFRLNDIQVYLPADSVHLLPDNLPVAQLRQQLATADFKRYRVKDAALTRSELRVCTMIGKGISLVRIAQLLNKSPKTIYTHKRNAMSKFHCRSLADFHRKICLLEQHASNLQ